jgi:hypothetical protein
MYWVLDYLTDKDRLMNKLINKLYGYGGNVLVVGCEDTANGMER